MKLCLIGDGNSIHIVRWAEWFANKGHDVQMISLTRLREPSKAFSRYCEIPVLTGPLAYLRRIFPIRDAVTSWAPDIVHGHYLTSAGFYAAMSGCSKVVVSAWGSDIYKDANNKYKAWCIKYAMNHADVVLGDSNHIVKVVKGMCPNARAEKIIFGIDTEKFKPAPIPHDKFRFLSTRATSPIYNPMAIVQGFEVANLDAELWMYLPTVECQDVKDYVDAKPELKSKVVWIANRQYDQMPELYNSVDVGISVPSWDSSSTAMMECMACGVPVIAGAIPQVEEWILGHWNGFLSQINSECLAKTMAEAISPKTDLQLIGGRARDAVYHEGDYQTEMRKAEKFYQEVLDANR